MTKYIHPEETLNIYYRVSEDTNELEDIVKIEKDGEEKNISDLPDLQNTKIIQWSPDEEHLNETFEFNINGFGKQDVKIIDAPNKEIDYFEDEDRDAYQSLERDNFTISTSNPYTGTYHFRSSGSPSNSQACVSIPNNGLNHYPKAGDYVRLRAYIHSPGGYQTLFFMAQSSNNDQGSSTYPNNTYYFSIQDGPSIGKAVDGNTSVLASSSESTPIGEYFVCDLDFTDLENGNITHTMYSIDSNSPIPESDEELTEIDSVTGKDEGDIYDSGGIGFRNHYETFDIDYISYR